MILACSIRLGLRINDTFNSLPTPPLPSRSSPTTMYARSYCMLPSATRPSGDHFTP